MSRYVSETFVLDRDIKAMILALKEYNELIDDDESDDDRVIEARGKWFHSIATMVNSGGSYMLAALAESIYTGETITEKVLEELRYDVEKSRQNRIARAKKKDRRRAASVR